MQKNSVRNGAKKNQEELNGTHNTKNVSADGAVSHSFQKDAKYTAVTNADYSPTADTPCPSLNPYIRSPVSPSKRPLPWHVLRVWPMGNMYRSTTYKEDFGYAPICYMSILPLRKRQNHSLRAEAEALSRTGAEKELADRLLLQLRLPILCTRTKAVFKVWYDTKAGWLSQPSRHY